MMNDERRATDVVFASVGDVRRNSRSLRHLRALSGRGLRVEAITFGPPAADAPSPVPDVRLRVIERPGGGGPRFFWKVHRRFRRAARRVEARAYHASGLYVLPALHGAAQKHSGRLVYDARELYAHLPATVGRPWVHFGWKMLERYFIRRADAVFTVSPGIADWLARAHDVERPRLLLNAPASQETVCPDDALRRWTGLSDDTVLFLHQGNMQRDRGCVALVEAFCRVEDAALVFLGGGPLKPDLAQVVEERGAGDRIHFLDPVPPDELLSVTASADVGITMLEDTCLNHRFALPNKLFQYVAAGLPILASNMREIERVVRRRELGCVVDPADIDALAATVRWMAEQPTARRRWARNTAEALEAFRGQATRPLTEAYETLLSKRS
jgi:glycosyltransferase involved in cell wall biosynthesis